MKRFYNVALVGLGMLALSVGANAQGWGQGPYNAPRNDGRYGQPGAYGAVRNERFLISRVMTDLNRVAEHTRMDGRDRRQFEDAAENLRDFENRWSQGRFDTGKLDRAIRNLQRLTDSSRVYGRDREMLARDTQELREFRATGGRYDNWR